jgi:PAS domain S-box-containing protein
MPLVASGVHTMCRGSTIERQGVATRHGAAAERSGWVLAHHQQLGIIGMSAGVRASGAAALDGERSSAGRRWWSLAWKPTVALLGGLLLVLLTVPLVQRDLRYLTSVIDERRQAFELLLLLEASLSHLQEVEIAQRDVLLSGAPADLQRYRAAASRVEADLARLGSGPGSDLLPQSRAVDLVRLVRARLAEAATVVTAGQPTTSDQPRHALPAKVGSSLARQVQTLARQLEGELRARVDAATEHTRAADRRLRLVLYLGSLSGLAGLGLAGLVFNHSQTARRRAMADLSASEARLRLALHAARKGMWEWDLRANRVTRNEREYELFGLPVSSKAVTGVKPFFDHVHPEDLPGVEAELASAMQSGADFTQEFRILLPDGTTRWLAGSGRVFRDEHDGQPTRMIGVNWDISERKRQEQVLAESAARLRAVVETAVDGILTIDEHGTIETANPAVAQVFGYAPAELIGQNVRVLMPEPYRSEHDGYLERYRRTGERRIIGIGREVMGRRKDGSSFPVELAVAETLVGGKRLFTGIVRDITERKQAETRQALLRRELNHRVKNILAVVQSVALLTGRRAESLDAFLQGFQGRLQALAAANEVLVRSGWRAVDLDALLRGALLAHGVEDAGRFELRVANLPIGAALAQDVALALHELATNAAKHGALSVPDGRVAIEAGPVEDGAVLRLVWRERGGPPVTAPARQGFGTRLLGQLFTQQHGGSVALDWQAEGLICRIELPCAAAA